MYLRTKNWNDYSSIEYSNIFSFQKKKNEAKIPQELELTHP